MGSDYISSWSLLIFLLYVIMRNKSFICSSMTWKYPFQVQDVALRINSPWLKSSLYSARVCRPILSICLRDQTKLLERCLTRRFVVPSPFDVCCNSLTWDEKSRIDTADIILMHIYLQDVCAVTRSDLRPPGMQTSRVRSSRPANILSWRFGHELISTAILFPPYRWFK